MLQLQGAPISDTGELHDIKYPVKGRSEDRGRRRSHTAERPSLLSWWFFQCHCKPHPSKLVPLGCSSQLLLFSAEGSWFNSVTFLKLNVGRLLFSFFCLLLELNSDKRNDRKINSTLHSSFFKHLCGNWAVCSVAPRWLKMSMGQWTEAFASVCPWSTAGACMKLF